MMAVVNQVKKVVKMDLWNIVRFQVMVYSYLNNHELSDADLNCLTLLSLAGERELSNFCDLARKQKIFKTEQSARNSVNKCVKEGLIVKRGEGRKKVKIDEKLKIQTQGNILCDLKVLHVNDTQKA